MNKHQVAGIIIFIVVMLFFVTIGYIGIEGQKIADECRNKYGGTFDSGYCNYIRDGNSYSKYMTKDVLGGKGE